MSCFLRILSIFLLCLFNSSPSLAICASKIVFIEDVSPTTAPRSNEAVRIANAISQATNNNFVHVKFDTMHKKTGKGYGPYSLPGEALAFATQHCDDKCNNSDSFGRTNKCAIIYWGDNAVMHKNPFVHYLEIGFFKDNLAKINTTHRFFIDFSYMPTNGVVSPVLYNIAKDIKESTKQASYRGYQRLSDTSLSDTEINQAIAGVMDKFGHSE